MTTLLPTSQPTGVEAYEDMFKEITRKLYGDESAHGLYPYNTQVAQLAPGAPTIPSDGGERSFTTLTQIGYETTNVGSANQPSSSAAQQQQQQQQQEHITTAFGLAALMQNGFPPPSAILNPVNVPTNSNKTPTNISIPSTEDRWQSQPAAEEAWNGGKHSTPSGTSTSYGKSYKKPKTEPHDATLPAGLNIPSTVDRANKGSSLGTATSSSGTNVFKRYSCTSCPYMTDRRDLFTRHENIHKDEKPFQCYACLKPFNRADHVKKHFLRMHRELEYEIAKTRRYPPGGSPGSKSSYYSGNTQTSNLGSPSSSTTVATTLAQMQLNIPTGSFSTAPSLVVNSHTLDIGSSSTNHNGSHTNQLLHIQNQQHHQQHQQSHNNLHSSQSGSVSIKQEKCSGSGSSAPGSLNTSNNSFGAPPDEKPSVKKIKCERKFVCTYCPWAGADNWGLKRHMNTHIKPFLCLLCDYKAARSERLVTHVLKVHNKKACSKCNFFAEDQAHLDAHLQKVHSHDMTKAGKGAGSASTGGTGSTGSSGSGSNCGTSSTLHHSAAAAATSLAGDSNCNALRNLGNAFTSNNLPTNIPTSGNGFGNSTSNDQYHSADINHPTTGNVLANSNAANLIETINQHVLATAGQVVGQNGGTASLQHQQQHWSATKPHRKRGPELLYSYLEADGRDSGDYARLLHMQAVGRNKASVTQDFRNAGGGDNVGDAGDSSNAETTHALSMAAAIETQMKMENHNPGNGGSDLTGNTTVPDNVNLSSLFSSEQLSFMQLLAAAAVAHQQLQLHSSQKKQQDQKPSKAADHHPVGASNGIRYGSTMDSSPPATSTYQQQQSRTEYPSTNTSANGTASSNSTNGTSNGVIIPIDQNYQQSQPLALDMGSFKKRRANASSSDKENHVHRKRHDGSSNGTTVLPKQCIGIMAGSYTNGGSVISGDGTIDKHISQNAGSKVGQHQNPHHHNNNNNNTRNKNINDIFDKVYKKPHNSFHTYKHQSIHQYQQSGLEPSPQTHSLTTILRTAPPSAVEEENQRKTSPHQDGQDQAEQFSLVEFLKNHTEVSISTVAVKNVAGSVKKEPIDSDASQEQVIETDSVLDNCMQKQEYDRNPRKRYHPRRIQENEVLTSPSDDSELIGANEAHCRTKTSLILHKLWRHHGSTMPQMQCCECSASFRKRYKLILHQKLTKHTGIKIKKHSKNVALADLINGSLSTNGATKGLNADGHSKRMHRKRKSCLLYCES
ncbi:protein charlatan isoform X2 [Anopheles funestus]|uniref:protein charlatan isoform X2 n=1 Tax=Anopheles funestus TaxID=62324 RepID=UPI0020C621EA|nr:protein charlatan isoform X2 [Anopheles funestus]